ncbi:MAG: L-threonylcarbamoyladenylate synthase [Desulfobacca sp.]|uniref:L-threonylcarbamoyladenylate synthase n=1 Tax=Desulfobacca sp. TaxID=2067990 RepID=UPI0040495D48
MAKMHSWRGPADDQVLRQAAQVLAAGGVVACPTETFYALAVDAGNEPALIRILALKGRPASKPLLVLVADREMLHQVAAAIPPLAETLMARFWPGPLTLILPARPDLPFPLTGGSGTIGVRQPGLALTRRLVGLFGRPLTGTSANLSGQRPLLSAAQVQATLGSEVDIILQDGPCPGGLPSTIVDVVHQPPRVLRPGVVPVQDLSPYLGQ